MEWRKFFYLVQTNPRISKKFNVLLLDLRGHGNSPKQHQHHKNYSFKAIAHDILEVIDHLKIKILTL
jgi:pimeloyl-ACP methyl ester carboxylesterase